MTTTVTRPAGRAEATAFDSDRPSPLLTGLKTRGCTILAVSSASGGCGTSVFASLLASRISQTSTPGLSVGLVDAGPDRGGLDVLLGMEADRGLRWSQIRAPMGSIDPESLVSELPDWDGVRILSADPWNGRFPDPWEVEAAFRALAQALDVLVVDCGTGSGILSVFRRMGSLSDSNRPVSLRCIDVVPLSVQAIACERALIARHRDHGARIAGLVATPPVGYGMRRQGLSSSFGVTELCAYLQEPVIGLLRPDRHLAVSLAEGLGIVEVPRSSCAVLDECVRAAGIGDR